MRLPRINGLPLLRSVSRLQVCLAAAGGGLVVTALLVIGFQPRLSWMVAIAYLFWGYLAAGFSVLVLAIAFIRSPVRLFAVVVASLLILTLVVPFGRDDFENFKLGEVAAWPSLKVITFNWMADNPNIGSFYPWLRAQSADVVAIEEFTTTTPGVVDQLYPLFPFRTHGGGDILIMSKYPIIDERDVPIEEHSAVIAQISVRGRTMEVVGIHAPTLRNVQEVAARNAYLSKLAYFLPWWKGARLVIGDFNATRWDPYFSRAEDAARAHEAPRLFPLPTRMGVRSGLAFMGSPIDHVLIDRSGQLTDCRTGPSFGSDHVPLICDARFFGR